MSTWEQRYNEQTALCVQLIDERDRLGAKLESALRIMNKEQCEKLAIGDCLVPYRSAKQMRKACFEFVKNYPVRNRNPRKLTK